MRGDGCGEAEFAFPAGELVCRLNSFTYAGRRILTTIRNVGTRGLDGGVLLMVRPSPNETFTVPK